MRVNSDGYLMIEVILVMILMMIVSPMAFKVMKVIIRQTQQIIDHRTTMAEEMDMHVRLLRDVSMSKWMDTSCCLATSDHLICYDIKNDRLRRRKRQWEARRFYTHYIGQKKHYKDIQCSINQMVASVSLIKRNDEQLAWEFMLVNQ